MKPTMEEEEEEEEEDTTQRIGLNGADFRGVETYTVRCWSDG